MEGARLVEWFRLKPDLSVLKRGQDNALALFIADYINKRNPGPRRAYACAYYGEQDTPELDVVIPLLGIGFEIKLYQAPFAQTENKLKNPAGELKGQLPAYINAGCERIFYVSNLSEEMAASVLKMALGEGHQGIQVESIAEGIDNLLPLLNDIVAELQSSQEALFEQSAQRRISTALKRTSAQEGGEEQE